MIKILFQSRYYGRQYQYLLKVEIFWQMKIIFEGTQSFFKVNIFCSCLFFFKQDILVLQPDIFSMQFILCNITKLFNVDIFVHKDFFWRIPKFFKLDILAGDVREKKHCDLRLSSAVKQGDACWGQVTFMPVIGMYAGDRWPWCAVEQWMPATVIDTGDRWPWCVVERWMPAAGIDAGDWWTWCVVTW